MLLHLDGFTAGIEEFLKEASEGSATFDSPHSSFFPMLHSQASWQYSRKGDVLHLHDGQHVYAFKVPKDMPESFPSERLPDSNHAEFLQGSDEKGVAQVHRADPGSIYLTLQDGKNNPTFTLQHQHGAAWKGIPKQRLLKMIEQHQNQVIDVDPKELVDGAKKEAQEMLQVAWDRVEKEAGLDRIFNRVNRAFNIPQHNQKFRDYRQYHTNTLKDVNQQKQNMYTTGLHRVEPLKAMEREHKLDHREHDVYWRSRHAEGLRKELIRNTTAGAAGAVVLGGIAGRAITREKDKTPNG
jgi:hypothetical protein